MTENAQIGVVGPPVTNATQISVGVSPAEITLSFGSSRIVISPDSGMPQSQQAIDWHSSFGLSPVVVKGMVQTLSKAIEAYESQFGLVPNAAKTKVAPKAPSRRA